MHLFDRLSRSDRIRNLCVNVLKRGPIPRHVAFIMDGNRRYARERNLVEFSAYKLGIARMKELYNWCADLGVAEVTFYIFSIDNFGRSKEEVLLIMELLKTNIEEIFAKASKYKTRYRIIGNTGLLHQSMQQNINNVTTKTRHNTDPIMNIAVAYTSSDEITRVIASVAEGVKSQLLRIEDIDEQLLDSCIYSTGCSKVDLCIRTSGTTRLSDFLLWQLKAAQVYFEPMLWPEFGFWDLLRIVFLYQRNYGYLKGIEHSLTVDKKTCDRVREFLEKLENKK